jgi:Protein of unknown function (DUF1549)/Planctomycete cytochrome C
MLVLLTSTTLPAAERVDFALQIRPILAENCFGCHGADTQRRQADLRLDTPAIATLKTSSGKPLIVSGKPSESELWQRIISLDEKVQMPPPTSGHRLSESQRESIQRWILGGGQWQEHWAYVAPQRAPVPTHEATTWPRNAIDHFIYAALRAQQLTPSAEADRATLLRRLSLDLTGLPPTIAEQHAFLSDTSSDAYEKQVDRLLASPRYGERMAQIWLDLARYADTHGFHSDSHRDMWRWRDGLIASFSANQPYDQFTREQLAGDLIPNATLEQRIASGFQRLHMINFENGAIAEEYRTEYVVDRVVTLGTVWLGQTWQCARCHDHKHDPISQRDFYRLFAYFNNVPENGLDGRSGNAVPFVSAPTAEQQQQLATFAERHVAACQGVGGQIRTMAASIASQHTTTSQRFLAILSLRYR